MPDFWELVPANPWERGDGLLPRLPRAALTPPWMQASRIPMESATADRSDLTHSLFGSPFFATAQASDQEDSLKPLMGGIFGAPAPEDLVEAIWPGLAQRINSQGSHSADAQRAAGLPSRTSGMSDEPGWPTVPGSVSPIAATSDASSLPGVSDFRGLPDTVGSSLTDSSPYFGLAGGQRGNDNFAISLITPANAQATTNTQAGGKPPVPPGQVPRGKPWPGEIVTLPNGSYVSDTSTATGYLTSPVADLSPVAEAGRRTGTIYRQLLTDPQSYHSAFPFLLGQLFSHVGHGGTFDYQRSGNRVLGLLGAGFTQSRHFRNVSNFNVGLFGQQAGLSLGETLKFAGAYAWLFSSNHDPTRSYGLDSDTQQFIEVGFRAGQSGAFGQAP